jgi:hypothetical protein
MPGMPLLMKAMQCIYTKYVKLLENIKYIYTSCRNRWKSEPLVRLPGLFQRQCKWIWCSQTVYLYCVHAAISKSLKQLHVWTILILNLKFIYLMRNEVSHTYSFCFCISQYKRINSNLLPMKCFPSFMSSRLHSSEFRNLLYPYCYGHSLVALFTKTTEITYRLFPFFKVTVYDFS